jgi:molecular chaperone GrpE
MTSQSPGHDPGSTEAPAMNGEAQDRPGPDGRREPDAATDPVVAELEDRWRRAVADLDNLRKRHAREVATIRAHERDRVAAAFLPVLDNLDLAVRHAQADPGAVADGVRAVREQAAAIVAGLGYPLQDDVGVPFDPARHDVVDVVAPTDEQPSGLVVSVVRPGYGTPEHQLRPAAVVVTGTTED